MEHQGNKVGSVCRKENKLKMMSFPVITSCSDIVLAQTLALVQAKNGSLVSQVL